MRGGENVVHYSRCDGTVRHAVVFRGVGILSKRDAGAVFDGSQTKRAVICRPREDHSDRVRGLIIGKRAEKRIDRHVVAPRSFTANQVQDSARNGHVGIRRKHINRIHRHAHPFGGLQHR